MSRFFIHRPIFATVISIIIVIAGVVSFGRTCRSRSFPRFRRRPSGLGRFIRARDAVTIAETVATPIEQEVNGVEGMMYMSSNSANDGSYNLTVTFDLGTDMDIASVLVQNRVSIAEPQLPAGSSRAGNHHQEAFDANPAVRRIDVAGWRATTPLFLSNYATHKSRMN